MIAEYKPGSSSECMVKLSAMVLCIAQSQLLEIVESHEKCVVFWVEKERQWQCSFAWTHR